MTALMTARSSTARSLMIELRDHRPPTVPAEMEFLFQYQYYYVFNWLSRSSY